MRTEPNNAATRLTEPSHQVSTTGHAMTRRSVLQRSMLGATGAGLAVLLAACGDENEEPVTGGGAGEQDPGDSPAGTAETGI